jgi:hypothetical protein
MHRMRGSFQRAAMLALSQIWPYNQGFTPHKKEREVK